MVNEDCPAPDFHEIQVNEAIERLNRAAPAGGGLAPWVVETLFVGKDMNVLEALRRIAQAKICLFDATHYETQANGNIFFLLGAAHAAAREAVPIINSALNRDMPFDIGGLWQVNFDKSERLENELQQILPTLDRDFKKEEAEYLYRRIWNPLGERKKITMITCGRGISEPDRIGSRTNVDLWDFNSVQQLSYFIAQKYGAVEVPIEPPKSKKGPHELTEEFLPGYHKLLREQLERQDVVIIGSPDVNDYAELALAELHGLKAHVPRENPSRLPYYFIKPTSGSQHPRLQSAFYALPAGDDRVGVAFGMGPAKTRIDCAEVEGTDDAVACAVITIAENPFVPQNGKPRWQVMILSGFTGVATYAAVLFLTDPKYKAQLEECFREYDSLAGRQDPRLIKGRNILLSVRYRARGTAGQTGDTRSLENAVIRFEKADLILRSDKLEPAYTSIAYCR